MTARTQSQSDTNPATPISTPNPEHSRETKKEDLSGKVEMVITVGADGKVHDAQIVKPLNPDLDKKALETVRNWTFTPAHKSGKPVAAKMKVALAFALPSGDPSSATSVPDLRSAKPYLLMLRTTSLSTAGVSQMTCLRVYSDGFYHLERGTFYVQDNGSDIKVFEDALSAPDLAKLREILDSDQLRSAQTEARAGGWYRFHEGEFVEVYIPRQDRVQLLSSVSYFGSYREPGDPGYKTDEKGHKLLTPVMDFVKNAIEKRKPSPAKNVDPACKFPIH